MKLCPACIDVEVNSMGDEEENGSEDGDIRLIWRHGGGERCIKYVGIMGGLSTRRERQGWEVGGGGC